MPWYERPRADGHGMYVGHKDNIDNEFNYKKHRDSKRSAVLRAVRGGEMQIREIAKHFDVHERTIARWAREVGIKPRINPRTPEQRQAIYEAYVHSTLTVKELSRKLNTPWATAQEVARTWALENGLPFRVRLNGAGRGHHGVRFGPWQNVAA